jgi:hypothetical protein
MARERISVHQKVFKADITINSRKGEKCFPHGRRVRFRSGQTILSAIEQDLHTEYQQRALRERITLIVLNNILISSQRDQLSIQLRSNRSFSVTTAKIRK